MKNLSLIFLFLWIFSFPTVAQTPQWAQTVTKGASGGQNKSRIITDQQGNIYVAGNFDGSLKFKDTGFELEGLFGSNNYVYKKSPEGELLWARAFGGSGTTLLNNIAVDNNGNVYSVGHFKGSMTAGSGGNSISISSNGNWDAYIVKHSATGQLLGAYTIGGTSRDNFTAITIDNDNNIILAGNFIGEVDFDLSQNTHIENCAGLTIVKFTENLELISVHTLKSYFTFVTRIEVGAEDELIFGGYFRDYVTTNSGEGLTDGPDQTNQGFLMKLSNLYAFEWAAGITGTSHHFLFDMQLTESGDIYMTGEFSNTANFISNDETQTFESNSGSRDIFFAKISTTGDYEWIKTMGGPQADKAVGIEMDNNGNIILAGFYANTIDFDPGAGIAEYTSEGNSSSFVSVYTPEGEHANTFTFENSGGNAATAIAITGDDEIYLSGWFQISINFDPDQPDFEFNATWIDEYLIKLSPVIVGLHEARDANPISIFPSPARDEVHIEAPNTRKIDVYNIHGKQVLSKTTKYFGSKHTIGVSHLPSGTYILSLTANDGFIRSEKFVVIK